MLALDIELDSQPTSRRQNAYGTILNAIVFGDLAPGSRLDEKSLASNLGIGIAGVRDALLRLSLERLVVRQPRTGTIVAGLDVQELQDVYEARILIECQSARIAALRADAQDLEILRKLTDEYLAIVELRDFRKLFKLDQIFHRAIARSTKNRILEQHVVVLHNNASRFWYAGAVARFEQNDWVKSRQSHVAVVERMEARDAHGAEKAMRECVGQFPGFVDYYVSNTEAYGLK